MMTIPNYVPRPQAGEPLTELYMRRYAPSVFCESGKDSVSDKYQHISTWECIKWLDQAGYYPVSVQESRSRTPENRLFAKHLLRFRREGESEAGGNMPEIILINSHNGLCSYQLRAGFYRFACANGLIVGNELYGLSVRHQGDAIARLVNGADELMKKIPELTETISEWKNITLSDDERLAFAKSASLLKWDAEESKVEETKLLLPRRETDVPKDLWTTYNTVQENMIKGGLRYYDRTAHRRGRTREVTSVTENTRLNMSLWTLTENMAKLAQR